MLLILAAVSIATLTGENGILSKAGMAKEETQKASAKEQAQIDILAWQSERLVQNESAELSDEIIKGILTGKDYVTSVGDASFITSEGGYEILYSELYKTSEGGEEAVVGEKVTGSNKEYTKNGTAVIPVGFTIVPGLDDVSKGLVISDDEDDTEEDADNIVANGNQFVWVPVSKENFATEFVREHFGTDDQKWWTGTFVTDEMSSGNMYEMTADGITVDEDASESEQEVQKMYKSVKDNGGFYIGRYEAGNDGSNNVLSKKGVAVYNNIGWSDSDDMTDETGGAVEKARGFASSKSYTNVTSTLCYGVQWDAVMRWISTDDELKGYLTDSTGKGNYIDSDDTNNPAKTGAVEAYQMKNIYDMAGNVEEWTMEASNTYYRVGRGGVYNLDGSYYPVSGRYSNLPSGSNNVFGFRVALYLDV